MALLHPPNYLLLGHRPRRHQRRPPLLALPLLDCARSLTRPVAALISTFPLFLSSSDIPSMAKVTAAAVAASSAAGPHLPPDRRTERPTNLGLAWLGSLRLPSGLLREITGLGPPTATAREGEAEEGKREWVFANTQAAVLSLVSRGQF